MVKQIYISNAFSLSMLDRDSMRRRAPVPANDQTVAELINQALRFDVPLISVVGHEDTAKVFSHLLGLDIQPNRVSVKLTDEDVLLVGQYVGPRLPTGATELPEGATIEWWIV